MLATGYVASSILMSGFYIRIQDMKVSVMRGLSYLSYTKYAMQGVARLELLGRSFDNPGCQAARAFPSLAVPCHLWLSRVGSGNSCRALFHKDYVSCFGQPCLLGSEVLVRKETPAHVCTQELSFCFGSCLHDMLQLPEASLRVFTKLTCVPYI